MQLKLKKIKSDASFREFFRLYKGKKTSIIVTAKKERFKNLIVYSAINRFLRKKGIYTPKLISQHFEETQSTIAEKILKNFDDSINSFKQVCPKEMLDKLLNPLSTKTKVSKAI